MTKLWRLRLHAFFDRLTSSPEADKLVLLQEEARSEAIVNRTLVSAQLTQWAAGSSYPVAQIRSSLGQAGTQPLLANSTA